MGYISNENDLYMDMQYGNQLITYFKLLKFHVLMKKIHSYAYLTQYDILEYQCNAYFLVDNVLMFV